MTGRRGDGETGRRETGDGLRDSLLRRRTQHPFVGVMDHADDAGDHAVVLLVEFRSVASRNVFALDGILEPDLSLCAFGLAIGKLADE